MTRRRFYAPPDAFSPDGATVTLSHDEARHLRDVLRLKPGDEAFVFDGEGGEYRCIVGDASAVASNRRRGEGGGTAARLEVRERVAPSRPESPLRLTLAVALLKGEKFDLVTQKATELGVTRITPVTTHRAEAYALDPHHAGQRAARWRRLALEAAKQSGRAFVPTVDAPIPFASLITDLPSNPETLRLMFAERGGRPLLETTKEGSARVPRTVTALVGPEGGWEDEEIDGAREAGWAVITLGGRTLRAETAGIVVVSLLQHLFGDLV